MGSVVFIPFKSCVNAIKVFGFSWTIFIFPFINLLFLFLLVDYLIKIIEINENKNTCFSRGRSSTLNASSPSSRLSCSF